MDSLNQLSYILKQLAKRNLRLYTMSRTNTDNLVIEYQKKLIEKTELELKAFQQGKPLDKKVELTLEVLKRGKLLDVCNNEITHIRAELNNPYCYNCRYTHETPDGQEIETVTLPPKCTLKSNSELNGADCVNFKLYGISDIETHIHGLFQKTQITRELCKHTEEELLDLESEINKLNEK